MTNARGQNTVTVGVKQQNSHEAIAEFNSDDNPDRTPGLGELRGQYSFLVRIADHRLSKLPQSSLVGI